MPLPDSCNGVDAGSTTYLATFVYEPSNDADGTFVFDPLVFSEQTPDQRSFLFVGDGTPAEIDGTTPESVDAN